MDMTIQPGAPTVSLSKTSLWTGRALSGVAVLFLLMDGTMKLAKPAPVVEISAKLGYSADTIFGIGFVLLACTIVYSFRRTALLGAILLTGYLGGAIATHVRVGSEPFSIVFPAIVALFLWGGLYLRDRRLRALVAR